MIKKFIFLIVFLSGSAQILADSNVASTVDFTVNDKVIDLQPYSEILIDAEQSLNIDNITKGKFNFRPTSEVGNSFGFTGAAYWLRFNLRQGEDVNDAILLELEYPLIDDVRLFIPDGQGGYSETVTGDAQSFYSRDINYRSFLFRLPEHRGELRTYYLRLKSEGSMQAPLSLLSSAAVIEEASSSSFFLGGYYSIMLLLMVVAIISFIKFRDRLFLYYALYLFSYLLFQLSLNGLSFQYLWPDLPWLTSRATSAFIGLVVIGGVVFSGSFLQIWNSRHQHVKRLFYASILIGVACVVLSVFGDYSIAVKLSAASGLLLPPVVMIGAVTSLISGYRPARYFFAAWGAFIIGIFIAGLLSFGLVPHNFYTFYAIQIGSILEVLLLGYALMDRYDVLHAEKEVAIINASKYFKQLNDGLETQVDERTKQLSESETHLRTLIQTLPDLVWWKNLEGIYMACNTKFERFFGAKQSEIIGKTDYDFLDSKLADFFRSTDEAAISAGKPNITEERVTYADDGHKELLETIKTPMYSPEGELTGVLGVGRDITERRRSEQALLNTQKMEAIGQLTGGIAHDFNNILSIQIGNISLLKRQLFMDEKASRRIDTIQKSAQRAADLTRQLLSFSRHKPDQLLVTDINRLIDEMDSLITHSVTPAIEVTYLFDSNLWLTEIDPGDFQDAVINLVLNARDAMPAGGHISLQTSNCVIDAAYCETHPDMIAGEYVLLVVSDSGEGISVEKQQRIFEPFYTTKAQGKGTGLGLSMVFGFVSRCDGHISVESAPAAGTSMKIYMPRNMGKEQTLQDETDGVEEFSKGRETILVVDDEEALLELAKETLEVLDYKVLIAFNGKQALAQLAQNPDIKLMVSDILMPGGMNGYELAERATERYPELRVLLTSGYSAAIEIHNNQARFSDNLLKKPYTLSELTKRARALLDEPVNKGIDSSD